MVPFDELRAGDKLTTGIPGHAASQEAEKSVT